MYRGALERILANGCGEVCLDSLPGEFCGACVAARMASEALTPSEKP
jgi:hypothetical protein